MLTYRNCSEQATRNQACAGSWEQSGEKIGHGEQIHERTKSIGDAQSHATADQRDEHCFNEKLLQYVACRSAYSFAHPNFPGALTHRNHHHVHNAEAAEKQSDNSHGAQKIFHAIGHLFKGFGFLHRIPDGAGFFVVGVKIMQTPQHSADFALASFVLFVLISA